MSTMPFEQPVMLECLIYNPFRANLSQTKTKPKLSRNQSLERFLPDEIPLTVDMALNALYPPREEDFLFDTPAENQ